MTKTTESQRVLIVSGTPPPYSGPEIMTAHLLNSSLKDHYELIHFNISKGRGVNEKARFDLVNITFGLLQPIWLAWLMLRRRPHVVYTNLAQNLGGFLRYAFFILISSLFNQPVVVRVMGDGFNHFYAQANRPLRWLIWLTLRKINCFILRAEVLKDQFAGLVPPEKLHVVFSGIDTDEFNRQPAPRPDDRLRILFVGYLTKAKGAHDLLRAVPPVAAAEPRVLFRLMGERVDVERNITYVNSPTSNRAVLDELLAQPDIAAHVELLGVLSGEAKLEAFVNADLFVFPSYSEAFPTVVLEAMAAGLPVIATPVGALPEAFDAASIRFVTPGDEQALVQAILEMMRNPDERARMGQKNRLMAQTLFNFDVQARRMGDIFAQCISESTQTKVTI